MPDSAGPVAPRSLKQTAKRIAKRPYVVVTRSVTAALSANGVLSSLHRPPTFETANRRKLTQTRSRGVGLPLPPAELRQLHAADDADYLAAGENSSAWIRRVADREGIDLATARGMDWGCATGRVIRHFEGGGEWWGLDADGDCIEWCKANLSPPFKFLTSTAYPHLPFEDNSFDLIFAGSVFTHLYLLVDVWLMEFRRIMRPGAIALFTIHDEETRRFMAEHPERHDNWRSLAWTSDDRELTSGRLDTDVEVIGDRRGWGSVSTFFSQDYIRDEWGTYFEVISFEPRSESYQTAVVLRKPL